jgi:hypothetical protein
MEIADGDRRDAVLLEPRDGRLDGAAVERRRDLAVEAHALSHPEAPRSRHEGDRRRHAQVVAVVLEPLAHLDDVAVAFGGEHADLRPLALEQRVGGDRGAVDDEVGRVQQGAEIACELDGQEAETVHDADGRVFRRGGGFRDDHAPGPVHGDEVSERAADVDPYAVHVSGSFASGLATRSCG